MGFKIDDFIGAYSDFSRGYLFYARISNSPVEILKDHPYLVNTASLPTQTIEAITTKWQGAEYKFGGTNTFAEFTINFKSDTANALRTNFLEWMNKIHDPVSNAHGVPSDYFGQVDLTQLDSDGNSIMNYSLHRAWPSSISEISLDYGNKEISSFDVVFTYQYHVIDDIQAGPSATEASA